MRPQRAAIWCLLFSLIGLGLCGYLFYVHLGLLRGELLGGATCGSGGLLNCHVVTTSRWATLLGMPLVLWGVIGYVAIAGLALLARQSDEWAQQAIVPLFALALGCVLVDLALLALMAFVIKAFCLFCLLTYAVNLLLLFVSEQALGIPWRQALRRLPSVLRALMPSRQRPAALLFWAVLCLGAAAAGALQASTVFVSRGTLASLRHQIRDYVTKQTRVTVDVTGDPALGPGGAPLQIVEFSDFLCPACQRASKMTAIITAHHRDDAQFIFKQFPLDTTCNNAIGRNVHSGACTVAAAAECAHQQGKFWAFHDLVFEGQGSYNVANVERDAARLGLDLLRFNYCMSSGEGLEAVKRDIVEAAKVGVTSTPTYVINGVRTAGGLHPATFEDFAAVLHERGK